ncbi:unnamed protein product [Brassica rapa]|uniref:Uncharacterized protein n=2 Tax=Brassica TaxID=3705 RepID=A0A3P6BB42_BRACM|nr:unnamed protein product [Brassica napus]CAG7897190.1 unnamed protein product [Brassica rapa]CDY35792.1 BnaA08g04530D [Brassica napus]VDD03317.1 unnamed protein product [Brassica rapa]
MDCVNLPVDDDTSYIDTDTDMQETSVAKKSGKNAYLEEVFSKKFEKVHVLIERLLGIASLIRRSTLDSYADTPFLGEFPLIEIPMKFLLF